MEQVDRDAYVVSRLAALAAQGLTPRQCVLEVMRAAGESFIILPGMDRAAMDTDTTGLQTAVADLADPTVRASAKSMIQIGASKIKPVSGDKNAYRQRVVSAGK